MNSIPYHLAIIMDGNRRWARGNGMGSLRGHQQGADTLKTVAKHAHEYGVKWLSVFAFSFENWKRPKPEVEGLMGLLARFLENDIGELNDQNVKLRVIGNRTRFSPRLIDLIEWAEKETFNNSGLNLTLALDYGGRQEIAMAARLVATEVASGIISIEDINEDFLKSRMLSSALPEIDLLIRTGGEQRVSNFMLWDISYAELHFTPVFWPNFTISDLEKALDDFSKRDRRFGGNMLREVERPTGVEEVVVDDVSKTVHVNSNRQIV